MKEQRHDALAITIGYLCAFKRFSRNKKAELNKRCLPQVYFIREWSSIEKIVLLREGILPTIKKFADRKCEILECFVIHKEKGLNESLKWTQRMKNT